MSFCHFPVLFPHSTQMLTADSVAYYNYSIAGTFHVKLEVVAEWAQNTLEADRGSVQKTGHFTAALQLQGGSPTQLVTPGDPQMPLLVIPT